MDKLSGFIAYPGNPERIGTTIKTATKSYKRTLIYISAIINYMMITKPYHHCISQTLISQKGIFQRGSESCPTPFLRSTAVNMEIIQIQS